MLRPKPTTAVMTPMPTPPLSRRTLLFGLLSGALLSACSAPRPEAGAIRGALPADPGGPDGLRDTQAHEVVVQAMSLVDTPYRRGGNTPEGGFDCSGLIAYVFRNAAGLALPRTVAELAGIGTGVHREQVRSADLVFFDASGPLSHAGIYVGGGRFVHAPSTGGRVRLDRIEARYWSARFSAVRRV